MTTTQNILRAFEKKGYTLQSKDMQPNLFGVRSTKEHKDLHPHDVIGVVFMDNGVWTSIITPAYTTIKPFLNRSALSIGDYVLLLPGQYIGVYKIGYHKLKYEALRQVGEMMYLINHNDNTVDIVEEIRFSNVHKGSINHINNNLSRYNNGGQIITSMQDFTRILNILKHSVEVYGNLFNYTLFEDIDF